MAERMGLVINIFENNTAEVVTDRRGACGGCEHSQGGCRSCLTSTTKMVSTAQNAIGARPGDVVLIHLKESALWTGAMLLYIVPILGLMTGAFIGASFGESWSMGASGAAIIFGFLGLAFGFLLTLYISKSSGVRFRLVPQITRIVEHSQTTQGTGGSSVQASAVHHACCDT
jgi:sigma-E factor negative regulatory protein RseC